MDKKATRYGTIKIPSKMLSIMSDYVVSWSDTKFHHEDVVNDDREWSSDLVKSCQKSTGFSILAQYVPMAKLHGPLIHAAVDFNNCSGTVNRAYFGRTFDCVKLMSHCLL